MTPPKTAGTGRRRVVVELTLAEAEALDFVVGNGWGDGDFAGYAGSHVPTQKRAMAKLRDAILQYKTPTP